MNGVAVHGGDLLGAVLRHGGSIDAYLDFSANVNPLGPPQAVLALLRERAADVASLARYPDPHYRELRSAFARHVDVASESILVANGSAALFDAIVRVLRPASCLLPTPAFSEYEHALEACGVRIIRFPLLPEDEFALDAQAFRAALERERPALCVLTNPHNPSGTSIPNETLRAILDATKEIGTTLVLDEAFIDYIPERSITTLAAIAEHLVVLRSVTKFYAMPAMRVGYAIASPDLVARAIALLPSWPITTLAAEAAIATLGDPAYDELTRTTNEREREQLASACAALGIRVFPAFANFLLLDTGKRNHDLPARLAADHRVLVRDCTSYAGLERGGYLRVAVRRGEENGRLIQVLIASYQR